jgi:hypothetical protein
MVPQSVEAVAVVVVVVVGVGVGWWDEVWVWVEWCVG